MAIEEANRAPEGRQASRPARCSGDEARKKGKRSKMETVKIRTPANVRKENGKTGRGKHVTHMKV